MQLVVAMDQRGETSGRPRPALEVGASQGRAARRARHIVRLVGRIHPSAAAARADRDLRGALVMKAAVARAADDPGAIHARQNCDPIFTPRTARLLLALRSDSQHRRAT